MSTQKQPTQPSSSALKVFKTLDVLTTNFATGLTPKDLCEATGFTGSMIVIHLTTLIEAGYAEKVIETDRYRPSARFAQKAVVIANNLDRAIAKIEDLKQRTNINSLKNNKRIRDYIL